MKKLSTFVIVIMLTSNIMANEKTVTSEQSGTCGDQLTWVYSAGNLSIEGCGAMYDYGFATYTPVPWPQDFLTLSLPEGLTYIGCEAFCSCSNLNSVVIPDNVLKINYRAFGKCSGLISVVIGKSLSDLGYYVFSECERLQSITVAPENPIFDSRNNCNAIIETYTNTLLVGCKTTVIPNSVTSIGEDAFNGQKGMTSIILPAGIKSIGKDAFKKCVGLNTVSCYAVVPPTLGEGVFGHYKEGCDDCSLHAAITLYVPKESIAAYKSADQWKYFKTILPIGEDINQVSSEETRPEKIVRNGQVLILRGDKTYTLTGQEVK